MVNQGDVIRINSIKADLLVLSKETFNKSGVAIVCPVLQDDAYGALNIRIFYDKYEGITHPEGIRAFDLSARHYRLLGQISFSDIQNVTDAIQSIFDYYPFSLS